MAAMPVLRQHGYWATVFLVAGQIGGSVVWDSSFGESVPLLSLEELRALQDVGVGFGRHALVHRPMAGMRLAELAGYGTSSGDA